MHYRLICVWLLVLSILWRWHSSMLLYVSGEFVLLSCKALFHCFGTAHFVYSLTCWWTSGLFSIWGLLWIKLLHPPLYGHVDYWYFDSEIHEIDPEVNFPSVTLTKSVSKGQSFLKVLQFECFSQTHEAYSQMRQIFGNISITSSGIFVLTA